ncbi:N-acetyltransferase [Niallia circulans]|uniref:N-acetyltransferase n=1 Tax=Niallia circulans TaxID=1397 RepID=A0A553SK42_NIACI|nr:GNAT family protein [Niallia circulans]TRZ37373.1 N-acetyltransferase [Niallia circulans]
MEIRTSRLLIREFTKSDWPKVYEYTSNSNVMHYIPEGVMTVEQTQQLIRDNQGENAEYFAVILAAEKKLIGHIAFFKYFGVHTYEIGWVFHPNFFNKGYATEAAKAVLAYGFESMKLHRIIATCQPENVPSYRVMEKIGMRKEGFFKKCIPAGDGWWDEYYYAILKEEWDGIR